MALSFGSAIAGSPFKMQAFYKGNYNPDGSVLPFPFSGPLQVFLFLLQFLFWMLKLWF